MPLLKRIYRQIVSQSWHLGFVNEGLNGIFKDDSLSISWVKSHYTDWWFADPFILDVTDDYIFLLVEEFRYKYPKGRIAKLTIDRKSLEITNLKIILEEDTHLSFPNILRRDGKIYVYPENANGGKLNLYEYDEANEKLVFVQTICDDVIWDSCITELFGKKQMFTAHRDDYHLDIYAWDDAASRFLLSESIESKEKNSRMAGQFFEYQGKIYCPFQNCEKTYGGHIDLKKVTLSEDGKFSITKVKELHSPHHKYKEGLHTLNEYKGIVVIDVKGFNFYTGRVVARFAKRIKRSLFSK